MDAPQGTYLGSAANSEQPQSTLTAAVPTGIGSAKRVRLVGSAWQVYEVLWCWQRASIRRTNGKVTFAYPTREQIANKLAVKSSGYSIGIDQIGRILTGLERAGYIRKGSLTHDASLREFVRQCVREGLIDRDSDHCSNVYWVLVEPDELQQQAAIETPPPRLRKRGGTAPRQRQLRPARADQPVLFATDEASARPPEIGRQDVNRSANKMSTDRPTRCQPISAERPYVDELRQHQTAAKTDVVGVERIPSETAPSEAPGDRAAEAFAALRRAGIFHREATLYSGRVPPDLMLAVVAFWCKQSLPEKVRTGRIINTVKGDDPVATAAKHGFCQDANGRWQSPDQAPAESSAERAARLSAAIQAQRDRLRNL